MTPTPLRSVALALITAGLLFAFASPAIARTIPGGFDETAIPLAFEPNRGQAAKDVRFLGRAAGYGLQLTDTELRLLILRRSDPAQSSHAVRMTWKDASRDVKSLGEAQQPGTVNYLRGSDPAKWRTAIPRYARVRQQSMYAGIDVVYYGNGRQIEYDLVIAPHADPSRARLEIEGATVKARANGDLDLVLDGGDVLTLKAPVAYQERDGKRTAVEAHYRVKRRGERSVVSMEVGSYDHDSSLVIDPIVFATFLGSPGFDTVRGMAVDGAGQVYLTGMTGDYTLRFPTTAGAFDTTYNDWEDAFITCMNADGTALKYSTFLGGFRKDHANSIAINAAGQAFVTGFTESSDFPTTAGAFDTTFSLGWSDAFVTRLNAAGTALVYSTVLGGKGEDIGTGIALRGDEAYVTGRAGAGETPFPTTAGAFDTTPNGSASDAFVTRLTPTGDDLIYSTLLGGSSQDAGAAIAVTAEGDAVVVGSTSGGDTPFPTTSGAFQQTFSGGYDDAFVTRLNTAGTALIYSTFLGGGGNDKAQAIVMNAAGEPFVAGSTADAANTFPKTAAAFDATPAGTSDGFVTRLSADGTVLLASTLLGGAESETVNGIALSVAGQVFVTGHSGSADYPTTAGAADASHNGVSDVFVTALNTDLSQVSYSTLLGGSREDWGSGIALNGGDVFVAGGTADGTQDFPATAGAFQTAFQGGNVDGFVVRLTPDYPPSITNVSPSTGSFAGGQTVTISGTNLFNLSSVTFGGTPASIQSATGGSAVVLTPSSQQLGTVDVVVANPWGTATSTGAYTYIDALASPEDVEAHATAPTVVTVSWQAVAGADAYEVSRTSDGVNYVVVGTPASTLVVDDTATAATAYLYRVRAVAPALVSPNAVDLATTITFTDTPLTSGMTVKKTHILELREAVNAVRRLTGFGDATYSNADATVVLALDLTELRARLDESRSALGLVSASYTDASVTAGVTVVKATHLNELRDALR